MTVQTLTTAGFTALCLILLAAVWYWHSQAEAQRNRAEQSDDWSDYWQHWSEEWRDRVPSAPPPPLAAATEEINTLRESATPTCRPCTPNAPASSSPKLLDRRPQRQEAHRPIDKKNPWQC